MRDNQNHSKKNYYKINLFIFMLYFFTSCGLFGSEINDKVVNNDHAFININENNKGDDQLLNEIAVYENENENIIEITWGINYYGSINNAIDLDSKIAQELSKKFDVEIIGSIYKNKKDAALLDIVRADHVPMLFLNNFKNEHSDLNLVTSVQMINMDEIIRDFAKQVRLISWEMIEIYAPRYAAYMQNNKKNFFDDNTELIKKYKTDFEKNDVFFLYGLRTIGLALETYSVYNLKWLELIGINPKNELHQINDNIYFTDTAFSYNEFIEIMEGFKKFAGENGMVYPLYADNANSLKGIFGLSGNVYENGMAVPYEASTAFKSYLIFLAKLSELGVFAVHNIVFNDEIGWTSINLNKIINCGYKDSLIEIEKDRFITIPHYNLNEFEKILITPPEIGPNGMQGGMCDSLPGMLEINGMYYINSSVTDKKLIKILQIFDSISFDPEYFVLTRFGIEEIDYLWQDKPYDSAILPLHNNVKGVYNTGMYDEIAGRLKYHFQSANVYEYIVSPEAKLMNLYPYKNDPDRIFSSEYNAFIENKGLSKFPPSETLQKIFMSALNNYGIDNNDWVIYMDEMRKMGLNEYIEIINKYPLIYEKKIDQ